MARIAFLQQTGKLDVSGAMHPGERMARARSGLRRHREAIDTAFAREEEQREEQRQEAQREMGAGFQGQTAAAQAVADRELEGEGFDSARIARIARALPEATRRVAGGDAGRMTLTRDEVDQRIEEVVELILSGDDWISNVLGVIPGGGEDISAGEMAAGERVLTKIDPKRAAKMSQQQAGLIGGGGGPATDQGADKQGAAADKHSRAAAALEQAAAALESAAGRLTGAVHSPPVGYTRPGRKQGGVHRRDEAGY